MTSFGSPGNPRVSRHVSTYSEPSPAQVVSDEIDLADGLRGLAALVTGRMSLEDSLAEIAVFAAQAIPNVDGAGVTVLRRRGATMGIGAWSVTAPFVREIDIIQYETLQEGPCITCMQERVAVISGSLGSDERWPRFGGRVARLGVSSSLSLPLLIGDQVVGSINCYSYTEDAFGQHAERLGSLFAGPAAVSVFNAQTMIAARDQAEQLKQALESRAVIDQAIGIIRARSGATAEEAFDRLRQVSQIENTKLREIAVRLVEEAARRARARKEPS